jgi:hypothetical protein
MERGQYQILGWSASARSSSTSPAPSATFRTPRLFIPLLLPLAPAGASAIWIEFADVVPVQRPHDADPGEHRETARRDEDKGFRRVLPLRRGMLSLGSLVL